MYSGKNPMLPAASKDVKEILLTNFNLKLLVSAAPSYIYINFGSHYSDWATGRMNENHYFVAGVEIFFFRIVQKTSGAHPTSFIEVKAAGAGSWLLNSI